MWVEALGVMGFAGAVVALFIATVKDVRTQLAALEPVNAADMHRQEQDAPA
jgi:hypothetical protein